VGLRYSTPGDEGEAPMEGTVQAAVTKPFTDEFRALEDNAGLLRQIAERTGGRVLPADAQQANLWLRDGLTRPVARESIYLLCAMLAIGVFLIDVAVRRVRLDLGVLRAIGSRAFGKSKSVEAASVGTLREARARAQAKMSGEQEQADKKQSQEPKADVSKRKFEYKAGMDDSPIGGESSAPLVKKDEQKPDAASGEAEDEGLGRLLKAKKRAKDEMDQD